MKNKEEYWVSVDVDIHYKNRKHLKRFQVGSLGNVRVDPTFKTTSHSCKLYNDGKKKVRRVKFNVEGIANINLTLLGVLVESFTGFSHKENLKFTLMNNDYRDVRVDNIWVNGRSISKLSRYRYENSLGETPQELIYEYVVRALLGHLRRGSKNRSKFYQHNDRFVQNELNNSRQSFGFKLRRMDRLVVTQKPLFSRDSFYLLDLFIPFVNLGIELDGGHHVFNEKQFRYDLRRDSFIKQTYGIDIVRIDNPIVEGIVKNHTNRKLFRIVTDLIMDMFVVKFDLLSHEHALHKLRKKHSRLKKSLKGSPKQISVELSKIDYCISELMKGESNLEDRLNSQPASNTSIQKKLVDESISRVKESSTTIPKGSTLKRVEAGGT